MTITALPPAPQPSDSQEAFNTKAFSFVAALNQFGAEANALAEQANSDAGTASTQAGIASEKADIATSAAESALLSKNTAEASAATAVDAAAQAQTSGSAVALKNDLASSDPAKGAAMVGIGAGRTQADKNAEHVSLKDFGIENIIFDGDSITEGNTIGGFKYSNYFKTLSYCNNVINTPNYAVGGAWIPVGSNSGNNITDRYNNTVRALRPAANGGSGAKRVGLHILIGTNDLSPAYGNMSAATVIANLTAYATQAMSDGFTLILGTILPRSDSGGWLSLDAEANRLAVNDAIKKGVIPADIVVDYASVLTDSRDAEMFHDKIHPTIGGSKRIAEHLNRVMLSGVSDKHSIGNTISSPKISGRMEMDYNSYAVFGKAYMETSIGTDNNNSTGFVVMKDLNEATADVGSWQYAAGIGGGLRLQALNDANNSAKNIMKWSRTGLNSGYSTQFRGNMKPEDVTGWFEAGSAYQKTILGHDNGSGAGFLIFENLGITAADEKRWEFSCDTSTNEIAFRAVNDAISNSNIAWSILRSGYVPSNMVINAILRPRTDNARTLGTASYRWSVVYAATGTINTSDANAKQQIRELSEAERAVAVRIKGLLKAFRFNDAVAEKGDAARWHFGVIAQEVQAAFKAEGLSAEQYGLFCYDEWEETSEEIETDSSDPDAYTKTEYVQKSIQIVVPVQEVQVVDGKATLVTVEKEDRQFIYEELPVFDPDGNQVMVIDHPGTDEIEPTYKPVTHQAPVMEPVTKYFKQVIRPAGGRFGIRYEELLAFVVSAL